MADKQKKMQMINSLNDSCGSYGMEINIKNTEVIIMNTRGKKKVQSWASTTGEMEEMQPLQTFIISSKFHYISVCFNCYSSFSSIALHISHSVN